MHNLRKLLSNRIPPALVFAFFAAGMLLLDRVLPVGNFEFFGRRTLTFVLVGSGVLLGLVSLIQFGKNRTSIDPLHPEKASTLVTGGIYQYSRNPMYLALLMVLLGWGLYLGNAFNTLLAAGFVGYMNAFQIQPEEEVMQRKFGSVYRQYCSLVRRWF